jgi:Protein of unknown function (DUF1045)
VVQIKGRETAPMRYAIYWCPDDDDPLLAAGESWLGRRITGAVAERTRLPELSLARFAQLTLAPSRYGFHATIVPPMTLIEGATEAQFIEAASNLARNLGFVPMPSLGVAKLSGFAALRPVDSEARSPRSPRAPSRTWIHCDDHRRRKRSHGDSRIV